MFVYEFSQLMLVGLFFEGCEPHFFVEVIISYLIVIKIFYSSNKIKI